MTDNKYLTVLVVPHDERNVRRLRLSYRWVKVGLRAPKHFWLIWGSIHPG